MNILIVEDEAVVARFIKRVVRRIPTAHLIDIAGSFEEAFHKTSSEIFDVILIDIFLGAESLDGIELCKSIRKSHPFLPLIIITASRATSDLEKAFAAGINDYLTKPFRPRELELRVQHWGSLRHKVETRESIEYKGITYWFRQNEFFYNGRKLSLSKKQKILLRLFLQAPEQVLSHSFLREKFWGDLYDNEKTRNLRSNIHLLRRTLRPLGPDWIQTQRGEGYMLRK